MMTSANEYWRSLRVLNQLQIDWLISHGVPPLALGSAAHAPLKRFDDGVAVALEDAAGIYDVAHWHVKTRSISMYTDTGFALGESNIDNPGTYSFDGALKIHDEPLGWLKSGRAGIVIVDWSRCFDRLCSVPKVIVSSGLVETYKQAMQPETPEVFVAEERRAA